MAAVSCIPKERVLEILRLEGVISRLVVHSNYFCKIIVTTKLLLVWQDADTELAHYRESVIVLSLVWFIISTSPLLLIAVKSISYQYKISTGNRGKNYARYAEQFPDLFQVVAVAEPREHARSFIQKLYSLPQQQ